MQGSPRFAHLRERDTRGEGGDMRIGCCEILWEEAHVYDKEVALGDRGILEELPPGGG